MFKISGLYRYPIPLPNDPNSIQMFSKHSSPSPKKENQITGKRAKKKTHQSRQLMKQAPSEDWNKIRTTNRLRS